MAHVTLICKRCNASFETQYKYRAKRQFCSQACAIKSHTGTGNPAYGKTYRTKETHPEWAAKTSATSKARQINAGDKNGMKNPEVAKRMSITRRAKVTSDPEYRRRLSENRRAAWAAGEYDGVAVGRCKWYDHTQPDGSVVKLQGTWEVALARHLDALGASYLAHEGRWPYIDSEGNERFYYPDFYVPMWDVTIDVKGIYWGELGATKFDCVRVSNPNKQLIIATREILEGWGVDIVATQQELLMIRIVKQPAVGRSVEPKVAQEISHHKLANPYVRKQLDDDGNVVREEKATEDDYNQYMRNIEK